MTYYRCKCGKNEYLGSGMRPNDCEGCAECGTTLATSAEGHKPVAEHTWDTRYDERTGKPYRRCTKCLHKDTEAVAEKEE